jgi:hypothetical protein
MLPIAPDAPEADKAPCQALGQTGFLPKEAVKAGIQTQPLRTKRDGESRPERRRMHHRATRSDGTCEQPTHEKTRSIASRPFFATFSGAVDRCSRCVGQDAHGLHHSDAPVRRPGGSHGVEPPFLKRMHRWEARQVPNGIQQVEKLEVGCSAIIGGDFVVSTLNRLKQARKSKKPAL